MVRRLATQSPEILSAVQSFGLDPNDVKSVDLHIDAMSVPTLTITLFPDHALAAKLLAAARSVDPDITVNQSTDNSEITGDWLCWREEEQWRIDHGVCFERTSDIENYATYCALELNHKGDHVWVRR